MGVNLRDLIVTHEIQWEELRGKSIAVDAMNTLYQFLTTIRQPDGTPLMDQNGKITSHITGVFYRTVRVYEQGVKPAYVFDGKPPDLKGVELERRGNSKREAEEKWKAAKEAGDLQAAKKYASMTSRFTEEMLADSKKLIEAMGIPIVQAPSEGEVQCAHMAKTGKVYATGSQDYDALVSGSPVLVKNMTMQEKFQLERILLDKNLKALGITQEQLVDIAILIGTDFNKEGIKGIGPKKAIKIVKEGKFDEFKEQLEVDADVLRKLFLEPEVTDDFELKWKSPNLEEIKKILVDEHSFSEERVERAGKRLNEAFNTAVTQSSLSQWF